MRKLTKTIVSFLVIFIVFVTVVGCLDWHLLQSKPQVISAHEGLEKTNSIAKGWRQNATLVVIYSAGEVTSEGKATKWRYSYAELSMITNTTKGYDVILSSDGSFTTYETKSPPTRYALSNWTIDSDEAIKIARENPTISTYLSTYKGATIESMAIGANQTCSGWTIEWSDQGFMDNPHSAKISIDANTGNVIYIESDA